MSTLARWRLVHNCGMELLEISDAATQVEQGLSSLLRLVPGDVAGEVEIDARGVLAFTESPELLRPSMPEDARLVFRSNPAVIHLAKNAHLAATRMEDLCAPEEWARNPMRRHLLQPNRVPFAIVAGSADGAGGRHGWGVNRSRPFTDGDVEILGAFADFLHRAAVDRRRRRSVGEIEQAVSSGAGLLLWQDDHVLHVSGVASALIVRHRVSAVTLMRLGRSALGPSRSSGAVPTRCGVLRLRWVPDSAGGHALLVDEVVLGAAAGRSRLTNRQYVILCHLSRGLTAAAMARRLGVSERTVHKHLENLYRGLGVVDRLGAVSRGQALGLLPVIGGCEALDADLTLAG